MGAELKTLREDEQEEIRSEGITRQGEARAGEVRGQGGDETDRW